MPSSALRQMTNQPIPLGNGPWNTFSQNVGTSLSGPTRQTSSTHGPSQTPAQGTSGTSQVPNNVVTRARVRYSYPNGTQPPVPGTVYVTSAPPPQMGHFIILVRDEKVCDWPLSAWSNHVVEGNAVTVHFKGFRGGLSQYHLSFTDRDILVDLVTKACRMRNGEDPKEVPAHLPGDENGTHRKPQEVSAESVTASVKGPQRHAQPSARPGGPGGAKEPTKVITAPRKIEAASVKHPDSIPPQNSATEPIGRLIETGSSPTPDRILEIRKWVDKQDLAGPTKAGELIDFTSPVKAPTSERIGDHVTKEGKPEPPSSSEPNDVDLFAVGQTKPSLACAEHQEPSVFELLATLDASQFTAPALEASGEDAGTAEQEDGVREMQMHLYAVLDPMISLFHLAGKAGQTNEELVETVKSIKLTIVENYRSLAKKGAFFPNVSEPAREKVFEEFLAKPIEPPASKDVSDSAPVKKPDESYNGGNPCCDQECSFDETVVTETTDDSQLSLIRRIEYTDKELLALKARAAPAPARLAALDFLPKTTPGNQAGKGSAPAAQRKSQPSLEGRVPPKATAPEPKAALPMPNVAVPVPQAAAPMPKAAPLEKVENGLTAKENTVPPQGNPAGERPKAYKGLTNSRWAVERVSIQKKEAFTGPEFEKNPRHSALADLATLSFGGPASTAFGGPVGTSARAPTSSAFGGPVSTAFGGPVGTAFRAPTSSAFGGPVSTAFGGPAGTVFRAPVSTAFGGPVSTAFGGPVGTGRESTRK